MTVRASKTHALANVAPAVPTIKQDRFELYLAGAERWAVVAYSPRLAGKLNKLLEHYPADVTFTAKDEPLFCFGRSHLAHVLAILGVRGELPWLK